jgi:hypothetical protein
MEDKGKMRVIACSGCTKIVGKVEKGSLLAPNLCFICEDCALEWDFKKTKPFEPRVPPDGDFPSFFDIFGIKP